MKPTLNSRQRFFKYAWFEYTLAPRGKGPRVRGVAGLLTLTLLLSRQGLIFTHNPPGWEMGAWTGWSVVQNEAA
jgi:hypothetical protein